MAWLTLKGRLWSVREASLKMNVTCPFTYFSYGIWGR